MLWQEGLDPEPPEGVLELLAAEAWGVPPWVIAEQGSVLWLERWRLLNNQRNRKRE